VSQSELVLEFCTLGFYPCQALCLIVEDLHDFRQRISVCHASLYRLVQFGHSRRQRVLHFVEFLVDLGRERIGLFPCLFIRIGRSARVCRLLEMSLNLRDRLGELLLLIFNHVELMIQRKLLLADVRDPFLEFENFGMIVLQFVIPGLHFSSLLVERNEMVLKIFVPEIQDFSHRLVLDSFVFISHRNRASSSAGGSCCACRGTK